LIVYPEIEADQGDSQMERRRNPGHPSEQDYKYALGCHHDNDGNSSFQLIANRAPGIIE